LNFENIKMAVVRRKSDGVKINIAQVNEENRNHEYECIVCGSKVIPAVPDGKTVNGKPAKVTSYFKHYDATKCSSESWVHFWLKTEFIKVGDKFKVITDKENEYICNQIFFEKSIIIGDRKYIPDVTIYTSCGNVIHFEINYSNSKKVKDYIDRWENLNQIVVEADTNTMLCAFTDTIPTFKALYYQGKFFNLNDEDTTYYNTIGKYKVTKKDKEVLNLRKSEIEKLDWLWDETRKLDFDDKGFEKLSKLLNSISDEESRRIAIDILHKTKCNNFFQKYMLFVKNKIEKRLKYLNLKYKGCSIRYEIEIPRLIYDRVFKGIIINLYAPDNNIPVLFQTNNLKLSDDILTDDLKRKIDNKVEELSFNSDLLLYFVKSLLTNKKIESYKVHYKENTDYLDAIYFNDYRNKKYVVFRGYEYKIRETMERDFNEITANNTEYISLNNVYSKNNFIIETENSYEFANIHNKYKFQNIFQQETINLSYKRVDNTYNYLPMFNFINKMNELILIQHEIYKYVDEYEELDDFSVVHKANERYGVFYRYISSEEIDNKIRKVLYPMVCVSNSIFNKYNNTDTLNIRLNKSFTNDSNNHTRGWLIKDFIELLDNIGIENINNIE
jgi:hypothetical protein